MESEHIVIGNLQEQYERVGDILDDYLFRTGIEGKDATRFNLLTEEAVRLAKDIGDENDTVEIWLDGNKRVSNICLKMKTKMNPDKQEELLSISTSGENGADRTFFDNIKEAFIKPKKATWSLAEYEAELMMKRQEDPYAQESWENLERSVLANLADDIAVGVKDNNALMIIRKDFSPSIKDIGSKRPKISTDPIYVSATEESLSDAYKKLDKKIAELKLEKKDGMHVKLLFEETIGMLKGITDDFNALIWAEKFNKKCCVKLVGSTKMDADKKHDILSISSSGKNDMAKGFMGKVKDIIETGILNYENVMSLNQKYNGVAVNYGGLGMYCDAGIAMNPGAYNGFMWSMTDYKKALENQAGNNLGIQGAWDELEKSIVANIADDVIVGVKEDKVQMTIIYNLKEV